MRSFATWITRHRRPVVFAWIVIVFATGFAAAQVGSDFKEDFNLPKSDSQKALTLLEDNYPSQAGDTGQIVFDAKDGLEDPAVKAKITSALDKIAKLDGISDITSPYGPEGAVQISAVGAAKGQIGFATVNWSEPISMDKVEAQVDPVLKIIDEARKPDLDIQAGGNPFITAQQSESSASETVGVTAAMLVLFIMFGTLLAMGMPIITALLAVGTASSLITLSSQVFTTAQFATFLSVMIGLGVGIDYALFIITRFRQGLREGVDPREAVITAMDTAGRAVMFAGITVMIALLGLFLVGISFLHGPAIAASVTVLLTMSAALTLLPSLLTIAGHKINDPFYEVLLAAVKRNFRKLKSKSTLFGGIISLPLLLLQGLLLPLSYLFYAIVIWMPSKVLTLLRVPVPSRKRDVLQSDELAHPRWHKWSAMVQRRPWPVAIVSLTILCVLAIPAFSLQLGVADSGTDPADTTTRKAYDLLAKGFGPGFNGPLTIVVENSAGEAKLTALSRDFESNPNIAAVTPPVPSPNGKISLITVYPKTSPQSQLTNELVKDIRANNLASLNAAGVSAHIAGITAVFDDFSTLIAKRLPYFIGAVVLLSALLLLAIFRSIAIPIKAVVMNLLGILAAFGVVVAIFQWGWGADLIGVTSTAPIIAFLPVMMFAIVFGLSMDYEVFLMSRIHEEWERRGDAEEAVVEGMAATGGVITAAAVIMISLFASFAALSGDLTTKLFGVGLATTIFLDAFLIRSALVPAVMAILGEKAWYIPKWLDRITPKLNVEPPETLHTDAETGKTVHVEPPPTAQP
ncbi:MAG: MMPL family transporter [Solirubrobacterales bacterium]|nr:MMPL family transporter [Solirubrobacterales bacterium]